MRSQRRARELSVDYLLFIPIMLRSTKRTLVNSVKQVRSASSTTPPVRRTYTPRPRPSSPNSNSTSPSSPSTPTPTVAPVASTPPPPSTSQSIGSSSIPAPPTPTQTAPTSTSLPPSQPPSAELPSNDTYASYTPIEGQPEIDWSTSYHGLSSIPFTSNQADTLMRPLEAHEIEIKPGVLPSLYLSLVDHRLIGEF